MKLFFLLQAVTTWCYLYNCRMGVTAQRGEVNAVTIDIAGDDTIFFDLSAKTYLDQKVINFERFEGYITIVTNLAKVCHIDGIEEALSITETLFKVMPYSLNVIVFPFLHPNIDYDGTKRGAADKTDDDNDDEDEDEDDKRYNCDKFEAMLQSYATNPKLKNKLFIMEELKMINDPVGFDASKDTSDVHPVYQYLKSQLKINHLPTNHGTFFFVNPEGDRIDVLQEAPFQDVKDWLLELTQRNYEDEEL